MRRLLLALALLALAAVFALSCDSANPVAPNGSRLTISASPSRIGLNGEAIITVQGFRGTGSPLAPGTLISITTDVGTIQPLLEFIAGGVTIVELDDNGRVQVRLVGDGNVGPATVTASTTSGGDVTAMVMVDIGADAMNQRSVVISANPSIVPVFGESEISLLGREADGTPVPAGERIRLTADLGDLECQGAPRGGCQEVFTDANGEAEATFLAGERGGTGVVRAILGSSPEAMVSIDIRDAVETVTLVATPDSIERLPAPGATITLTATVQDARGAPLVRAAVIFTSNLPNTTTPVGTLGSTLELTDANGQADTTLMVTEQDVVNVGDFETFEVKATVTSEGVTRSDTRRITVEP